MEYTENVFEEVNRHPSVQCADLYVLLSKEFTSLNMSLASVSLEK